VVEADVASSGPVSAHFDADLLDVDVVTTSGPVVTELEPSLRSGGYQTIDLAEQGDGTAM